MTQRVRIAACAFLTFASAACSSDDDPGPVSGSSGSGAAGSSSSGAAGGTAASTGGEGGQRAAGGAGGESPSGGAGGQAASGGSGSGGGDGGTGGVGGTGGMGGSGGGGGCAAPSAAEFPACFAELYCALQFELCGCVESDFPSKAACIVALEAGWADEIDDGLQLGASWSSSCGAEQLAVLDGSTRKQFEAKPCISCSLLFGSVAEGDPCSDDLQCAEGLSCHDGLCSASCPGMLGQTCGGGAPACALYLTCDAATATCADGPGLGESCAFNECMAGLYCDGGSCLQAKPIGEACFNYRECESRVCDAGACAAEKPLICDD
ncbi:MAG: hypothetical protein WKG00_32480 [Polyangiaceae bacterium]